MKQFFAWTFVMATALAGGLVAQSSKVVTADDFDKAMKAISTHARAVPKLLETSSFVEITGHYVEMRAQFVGVEEFWAAHKIADAAMLTRNAMAKVDVIIKAANASDRPGIDAGIKELVAACGACHTKYREPDPTTPNSFVIKKGVL